MNNTRQIKTFIATMALAAAINAGYATFVSHTLHTYFALAVLVLGGNDFTDESQAAGSERQHFG